MTTTAQILAWIKEIRADGMAMEAASNINDKSTRDKIANAADEDQATLYTTKLGPALDEFLKTLSPEKQKEFNNMFGNFFSEAVGNLMTDAYNGDIVAASVDAGRMNSNYSQIAEFLNSN